MARLLFFTITGHLQEWSFFFAKVGTQFRQKLIEPAKTF